ncbi:hypothetical protein [Lentibacillus sediminis]|uniref:hypothetical protein n=1 Tax=Lentibacillus sediminis TaxID=1940529 RepID=UPI000C1C1E3B|nr:hypothetical protein [Lentibacillus sediminis]
MNSDIALLTIIHDKDGLIRQPLKKSVSILRNYYKHKYVAISDQTPADIGELLKQAGFSVFTVGKNGAANARRNILRLVQPYKYAFYHYCDLDRLITWALHHPEEFPQIQKQIMANDYLIIGRTEKAFSTHPLEWRETERMTNRMFSEEFGEEVDIAAGSCGVSRRALDLIVKKSAAKMTDAEWPLIVREAWGKESIGFTKADGLLYLPHNKSNDASELDSWLSRIRLSYIIGDSIRGFRRR